MRRISVEKRLNATRLLQSQGLSYATDTVSHTMPTAPLEPYWPDNRYYSFTSAEIELLERATKDVYDMCCEAAEYLIKHPEIVTHKMAIPVFALRQIQESWKRGPAWGSIYGRFDVCFGGLDNTNPRLRVPKFYEFNADNPSSLVESSLVQQYWLEQTGHGHGQYNSLYDELIRAWRRNLALIEEKFGHKVTVHFEAQVHPGGEMVTMAALLMDTCQQAGWRTKLLLLDQIVLSHDWRFYDQQGEHIDVIFKTYPWEWTVEHKFGPACFRDMEYIGQRNAAGDYTGGTVWIEPPYKMLWSNKALFAILWDLFKDDSRSEWLLPTYLERDAPSSLVEFARKPIYSRQGLGVVLKTENQVIQDENTKAIYGKEGYIIQELALPPAFTDERNNSYYPVLGLWCIDGKPAGMGIRESLTPITRGDSFFIPHSISDGLVTYEKKPVPDIHEIEASLTLKQSVGGKDRCRNVFDYMARYYTGTPSALQVAAAVFLATPAPTPPLSLRTTTITTTLFRFLFWLFVIRIVVLLTS